MHCGLVVWGRFATCEAHAVLINASTLDTEGGGGLGGANGQNRQGLALQVTIGRVKQLWLTKKY